MVDIDSKMIGGPSLCLSLCFRALLGQETPSSRMGAAGRPSRVMAMTMVFVAVLLCTKLAGPRASAAPTQDARALAVRELLTGTSAKEGAQAVKSAKMSAVHGAGKSAAASKQGALIKSVQKLDEEAPAEAAAPAAAEDAPPADPSPGGAETVDVAKDLGIRYPKDDLMPGWDKSGWSSGDWASWVITGPLITCCFSFFMFFTYGVTAGTLTLMACALADVGTFYYNW